MLVGPGNSLGECPPWYVAMRNAKYAGESFCSAYGITYGPIVESWAHIAEQAEIEAHNAKVEQAAQARG